MLNFRIMEANVGSSPNCVQGNETEVREISEAYDLFAFTINGLATTVMVTFGNVGNIYSIFLLTRMVFHGFLNNVLIFRFSYNIFE